MGYSILGDGRAATGSPDAFDVGPAGEWVPGAWSQGLAPETVQEVIDNGLELPWLGSQSNSLAPGVLAADGSAAWRDLDRRAATARVATAGVSPLLLIGLGLVLVLK